MSDKLKVLQFVKPEPEEDEAPRFPNEEDLKELEGDGLESVLTLTIDKSGHIRHFISGLTEFEVYGLMETVKQTMILNKNMVYES
jgi:hypothetical protein